MGAEIAFYDVETTIPLEAGQGYELLEFAAVVVSVPELSEISCYSTLIKPASDLVISARSVACNGITAETLANAPAFSQVADTIYTTLHGKVWAGHNIVRFDNLRLKEAFSRIGKPAPEATGTIDTLPLLRDKFGPRAGNMKMASLASYFGLGEQEHRSLSDVRMNLEVLKKCATLLFLESCFPEIIPPSVPGTPSYLTVNGTAETALTVEDTVAQSLSLATVGETVTRKMDNLSGKKTKFISEAVADRSAEMREKCKLFQFEGDLASGSSNLADRCLESNSPHLRESNYMPMNGVGVKYETESHPLVIPFDSPHLRQLSSMPVNGVGVEYETESHSLVIPVDSPHPQQLSYVPVNCIGVEYGTESHPPVIGSPYLQQYSYMPVNGVGVEYEIESHPLVVPVSTESDEFDSSTFVVTDTIDDVYLEAKDIIPTSITAEERPSSWGGWKLELLYEGLPLQIFERRIRVKFGLSDMYCFGSDGNPKFVIVVEPSAEACNIISICESLAREHLPSESFSTWRNPIICRDVGPGSIRIKIRTMGSGKDAKYITRFYIEDIATGALSVENPLGRVDAASFRSLIHPGCVLDIGFSCSVYNFNGYAGLSFAADTIIL